MTILTIGQVKLFYFVVNTTDICNELQKDYSCVHRKRLGLCRFCLHFSEFGYVTEFSMFQTFPMFPKNLEKVWDIEKCLCLCFLLYTEGSRLMRISLLRF